MAAELFWHNDIDLQSNFTVRPSFYIFSGLLSFNFQTVSQPIDY